jgi:TRAP-type C4-dicarboxylate transport system substrate-binding protein
VEGQENPLVMVEANRLYEIQTRVSLTGHMWSGFNLLANLAAWRALPDGVRGIAERQAAHHAALQRYQTDVRNSELVTGLARRGVRVNEADTAGMRARLGAFYARWKREVGTRAWSLLEAETGPLG